MKIFNININDFGGINNQRENFKKVYRECYLDRWDNLNKNTVILKLINCIDKYTPDVIILQEYDINSNEANFFKAAMEQRNYILESEEVTLMRPSMTVFYIKNNITHNYISAGHERNGRAYAINVDNIIIYGTHIPPKYDASFWKEINSFIEDKKCIIIGDFNTINRENMRELNNIIKNYGMRDIWEYKGNMPISLMGDYVIADKTIELEKIKMSVFDEKISDHPAILITID